jgi:ion channel-forming bestrophin family protein
MSRFHVPPILTPKTQDENDSGILKRSTTEMHEVMVEKRMALDLIEGYVVLVSELHSC